VAAAFVVNDGYEPAGEVAWLCPQPEAAVEIGLKVEDRASPGLINALAQARKCVSWEGGVLNIRDAKRVRSQEIGLIRVAYGSGPEISYWVARNTVQWSRSGKEAEVKR
jgi:hypothetical protein